jgi:endoglucanase
MTGAAGGGAGEATGAAAGGSGSASGVSGMTTDADAGGSSGSSEADASGNSGSTSGASGSGSAGVHAVGNQLYDGTKAIRLLGADRSGTEYACIQGDGFFDGPSDQASISAMLTWKINAVRVPLNEDCWLAINGSPSQYSGAPYQQAISAYVALLLQNGIYPILDLHWTAPGTTEATLQYPMPDMDHSVDFWKGVAAAYAQEPKVIFDLFNEPYPDKNMDATSAWTCWRDGGTCTNLVVGSTGAAVNYPVAGMQTLVNTVRAAGANNFIILGGLEYSNDLTQWLTYEPIDSAKNLGASWHVYDNNVCASTACYASEGGPVAAKVPIVASEFGAMMNCDGTFITGLLDWLDAPAQGIPGQSYLAWAWDTDSTPSIIADYTGTPKCNGTTYKSHLAAVPFP